MLEQRDFVRVFHGRRQVVIGVKIEPAVRVGDNGWKVIGANVSGDLITCLVADDETPEEFFAAWPISQLNLPLGDMNKIRHAVGRVVRAY